MEAPLLFSIFKIIIRVWVKILSLGYVNIAALPPLVSFFRLFTLIRILA